MVPNTLASCSRLRIIDLGINSLHGEIPKNLSRCSNLQKLNMEQNRLSGSIPGGLGMLPSLSFLCLSGNTLTGNIPLSLGSSSPLVSVVLDDNNITGSIPSLLASSSELQVLSLTKNQLSGEIPPALFNSTSLQMLALGVNNFAGSIPVLSNTDSPLQYLVLQSNDLAGTIPSTLGNFSSLCWLLLGDNNFHGSIPMSIGKIPHLHELDMTYNILSTNVPGSLYNMSTLKYLGIGENSFSGKIPNDIGYTLPSIRTLIMQGNQFRGQIPTSLANATNLQVINLHHNAFTGIIPSFGTLPNLIRLNLGKNRLEAGDWSFFSSLTNCTQLLNLYLDANILQGALPSSIGNLSKSLEVLLFTANKVSGTIPNEIGLLKNLQVLYMQQNFLTGNIPCSLGYLPNLSLLSLWQDQLSGQIPISLGNLSQLSELYLQENNLSGPIPPALGCCKNLEDLNLSCNRFHGCIPKQLFTLSSLSEGLDLSHNQLSGQIPLDIGGLINLGSLNISHNQLSGQIPSTLGECMDLSQNNFSGEIPQFLQSFSTLKLLNLSFNNLEGPVPTAGVFKNAQVFIQGNKLCASIHQLLQLPLRNAETSTKRRVSNIMKVTGFTAISLFMLSCSAVILLKRHKGTQIVHATFRELKKFSYNDIVRATNDFSSFNLVGSGKYGSVYKARFQFEEHMVAIKVFKLDQIDAPRNFLAECEALRNTRHRNLVRVITACSTCDPAGHDFKALILEYMPNGSLENWLYPKINNCGLQRRLSLGSRIMISMDIACALDYLHNHCKPPMVHCDLKPGNVLLDDIMSAHLGDFGLAKFLDTYSSSSTNSSTSFVGPRGSIGYIAPEYGFASKISTAADVYSYGIIILELLTRKRPTDDMFKDGLSLKKFVEKAFPQKLSEILDPDIIPNLDDEDAGYNFDNGKHIMVGVMNCITQLAKLGLSCSLESPKDRPTIQDVYAGVIAINEEYSAIWG
ncbi:hypothetical protein ACP4OV_030801 [Aristida adscensionis]